MTASLSDLVEQVRKELDEVTLSGEMVLTDSDLEDTASSNFSDQSIKDRLMDATRHIAARVRANYLDEFVITVSPSDFQPPYNANSPQILRLKGGQVTAGGTKCTRRTFAAHLKMENQRGVSASADYPVFVYQDFEFLVANGGSGGVKEAEAIRVPNDKYADATKLPDIFEAAEVQHAVFSCFETLRLAEQAKTAKKRLNEELSNYRLPFRMAGGEQQEDDS